MTGMGERPDDRWCLPLCSKHHREQHRMNEGVFWKLADVQPAFLALALYSVTGDHEAGEDIIRSYHGWD